MGIEGGVSMLLAVIDAAAGGDAILLAFVGKCCAVCCCGLCLEVCVWRFVSKSQVQRDRSWSEDGEVRGTLEVM